MSGVPVLALLWALAASAGAEPGVRVGLEVAEGAAGQRLVGRRAGLVAHAASLTADGRHAIDVLRGRGVELRKLFAPEHGLRSRHAAGQRVADSVDPGTGLPVLSLYGEDRAPTAAQLADLELLVFDLQGAGVRFYTYVSTLILALRAVSETDVELVVLDRPNPLGGLRIEGPVSDPRQELPESLLNMAPGPLVHGLTLGEMARFVNGRLERPARLSVVPMQGWRRSMLWSDTGLTWHPPSPNLRTSEAALAYPGTCLLEATNVSEGRGTASPFLLLGAPWLLAEELAGRVRAPGFALAPETFTPLPQAAAPSPKFASRHCGGVRVRVTQGRRAAPFELGVRLLKALEELHPQLRWREPDALDQLVGTRELRRSLERGDSVEAILARNGPAIEAFRAERAAALLY